MKYDALIQANADRWAKARFYTPSLAQAASVAKRLVAAKDRYISVSNKTGVPWFLIAVIHEREASQRWDRSLAQGDPWSRKSTHVPSGRGPFSSWDEAAYDALVNCAPYASHWSDWSAGGSLTLLELYNGLGYENHHIASPYLWSGTNQYLSGKYVSDGVFNPNVVDPQLGCAVLIDAMEQLDPSISFGGGITPTIKPAPAPVPQPIPLPEPAPQTETPTKEEQTSIDAPKAGPVGDASPAEPHTGLWASILSALTAGAGALTDWRIVAALTFAAVVAFIGWEIAGKPQFWKR